MNVGFGVFFVPSMEKKKNDKKAQKPTNQKTLQNNLILST